MAGFDLASNVLTRSIYVRLGNPDTFSDHVKRISARWRLRKHRGFLRIEVGHYIMKTGNPENFPKMPGFLEEDALFCRSLLQHFGKQINYNLFVCCRGPVETTSKPAGGRSLFSSSVAPSLSVDFGCSSTISQTFSGFHQRTPDIHQHVLF